MFRIWIKQVFRTRTAKKFKARILRHRRGCLCAWNTINPHHLLTVFSFNFSSEITLTSFGWKAKKCGYQGAKGPSFVLFKEHIQNTSLSQPGHTTNQMICTLNDTTNLCFQGQKVVSCLITLLRVMNLLSVTALHHLSHAEYEGKWNPITPSVTLIICDGVVYNEHRPFMSPTALSRSWHYSGKKKHLWNPRLFTLNGFSDQRCVWFIMCYIWRKSTAIHLFFPLHSSRMDRRWGEHIWKETDTSVFITPSNYVDWSRIIISHYSLCLLSPLLIPTFILSLFLVSCWGAFMDSFTSEYRPAIVHLLLPHLGKFNQKILKIWWLFVRVAHILNQWSTQYTWIIRSSLSSSAFLHLLYSIRHQCPVSQSSD